MSLDQDRAWRDALARLECPWVPMPPESSPIARRRMAALDEARKEFARLGATPAFKTLVKRWRTGK